MIEPEEPPYVCIHCGSIDVKIKAFAEILNNIENEWSELYEQLRQSELEI